MRSTSASRRRAGAPSSIGWQTARSRTKSRSSSRTIACARSRASPPGEHSRSERMIKPYTAVGLIPTVRGIRKRGDIKINLEHLSHLVKAASWLSSLDIPVRLIAFPEGALQAFNDEVLDLDHVTFARECAIEDRKSTRLNSSHLGISYAVFC